MAQKRYSMNSHSRSSFRTSILRSWIRQDYAKCRSSSQLWRCKRKSDNSSGIKRDRGELKYTEMKRENLKKSALNRAPGQWPPEVYCLLDKPHCFSISLLYGTISSPLLRSLLYLISLELI